MATRIAHVSAHAVTASAARARHVTAHTVRVATVTAATRAVRIAAMVPATATGIARVTALFPV
jgi:hypothetical protein